MSNAPRPPIVAPASGAEIGRAMAAAMKKNVLQAAAFAGLGAATGLAASLLLPRLWQGNPITAILSAGSLGRAGLACMLASTVVFALLGYWWTAGTRRFLRAVWRFPVSLASLFRAGGRSARVHLLWGAGLTFLASALVSPAVGAVVGATVIMSLPSALGGFVSNLLYRLWSSIVGLFSPARRRPLDGAVMMAIGLLGSVVALAAAFFLDSTMGKGLLAAGCVVLALLLARPKPDPQPK